MSLNLPAGAHQENGGDHRETQNAECERERSDLMPVEQRKGREIGIERRELAAGAVVAGARAGRPKHGCQRNCRCGRESGTAGRGHA